jgi:hypothetical protein
VLHYDVFNGDADGICALIQLRQAYPLNAELVTGVKRDIALLQQVPVDKPADVVVLDISMDANRVALDAQLSAGSKVFYCDHHYAGEVLAQHPNLEALIDTSPTACTSLLIDRYLGGRFREWAIVAAFGDNLTAVAERLARDSRLSEQDTNKLRQLGVCMNYNGYGNSLDDLHFHPADLFRAFGSHSNPLQLLAEGVPAWQRLKAGYAEDMEQALRCQPAHRCEVAQIVVLPDQPWSRRVSGVLGNELANRDPELACAVVTHAGKEHYLVSIRAPLNNRTGADELARRFPSGGGRKAAAGINRLPCAQLDSFIGAMISQWR